MTSVLEFRAILATTLPQQLNCYCCCSAAAATALAASSALARLARFRSVLVHFVDLPSVTGAGAGAGIPISAEVSAALPASSGGWGTEGVADIRSPDAVVQTSFYYNDRRSADCSIHSHAPPSIDQLAYLVLSQGQKRVQMAFKHAESP